MSVIEVEFPGNLAQVATLADLRGIPTSLIEDGTLYGVGDSGLFAYDASSVAVDNGASVLKPNDKTPLQAGRWLISGTGIFDIGVADTLAASDGASKVGYQYDSASVVQTAKDTVRREPLNLYDKIPRNLWAAIETGTNDSDLTQYVVAALGTGRGIRVRQGRYRMKLNVTSGNGRSIRGEGKQLTYFENVDNDPILTLDSSTDNIVGFEMEDCWIENRLPGTYTMCDLVKITGSGNGETYQNDSHHFRNVWFFQGRDLLSCYKRCIWPVIDGCNFTGAIRDGIHIETDGNVNQWEFRGRTIVKGNGRNGLFFKHDFTNLATGWIIDNMSTEDCGYEGWRFTGTFGIQGMSVRGCTFENNARLLPTGASGAIEGIRRRKANVFSDARYVAGLDINTTTFYNNEAGGTGGNPDYHIYMSAVDMDNAPVVVQSGAVANSRFQPTQTGNDVTWSIGLTYHNNNVNSGTVLIDEDRGAVDLRKFTAQDKITADLQLTGVTTPPVGTARYVKQGDLVTAYIPNLTGTSNSSSASLTGLPEVLWPTRDQTLVAIVQDGGVGVTIGSATVMPNGVITLFKDGGGGAFAPTGLKGVKLQTLTWALS